MSLSKKEPQRMSNKTENGLILIIGDPVKKIEWEMIGDRGNFCI